MKQGMAIGVASRHSGVKVPTIRYYHQIGLLPEPPRTRRNRRLYGAAEVERLLFIRHARELEFDTHSIRSLLALHDRPGRPCLEAETIARQQVDQLGRRILALQAMKATLEDMIARCDRTTAADCGVLRGLTA